MVAMVDEGGSKKVVKAYADLYKSTLEGVGRFWGLFSSGYPILGAE